MENNVNSKRERLLHLSAVHIIATIMIVFRHLFQASSNVYFNYAGQFLIVGNSIFFFVSGILSYKEQYNWGEWFAGKLYRIIIPMWIWEIILLVLKRIIASDGGVSISKIIVLIFNLQGFVYVADEFGHLWYITALFIFYFFVPVLHKFERKKIIVPIIAIFQLALIFFNDRLATYWSYFIIFSIGYLFHTHFINGEKKQIQKNTIWLSIISLFMLVIRIATHIKIDNSILYRCVIVLYQQHVTAIAIFFIIWLISEQLSEIMNERLIGYVNFIEGCTFFVYLVHPAFINGIFAFRGLNVFFQYLYVWMSSIFFAVLLKLVTELLTKSVRGKQ